MNVRLYRSRTDQMIGGVCSGLAAYLRMDPVWVRLFFVLLALGDGAGVMIYVILWLIMPPEGEVDATTLDARMRSGVDEIAGRARTMGEDLKGATRNPSPQAGLIVGGALILMGMFLFIDNLNLSFLWWFSLDVLWPLLLVLGGLVLLLRMSKGD